MLDGKARWMGLGDEGTISLAQARLLAAEARKLLVDGIDPIEHKRQIVAERKRAREVKTFDGATALYIEANKAGWRNAKHAKQWKSTLETYASPVFGSTRVNQITVDDVLAVLQPIWTTKAETAGRVRGRIETVLDYAKTRGWRSGENPARWKGHLDHILPRKSKVVRVVHHPALPWSDMPSFMTKLADEDGAGAKALQFLIFTAARTSEVTGMSWSEVNLPEKVWHIPAERMKSGREHRVPLSDEALTVLGEMKPLERKDGFVFPGGRKTGHLSNMGLLMLLRRMDRSDITAHGFRSSFRDWCGDVAKCRREVAEAALAHAVESQTEAAYARTDYLDERRLLMADWGKFCLNT